MFKPMTTAPVKGQEPYKWGVPSEGQCTWGAYYRALSLFQPPTWWDRATQTGSYTNANLWLENYRDPWQVKGSDYTPVAGDIAVFDGEYGHVIFIEQVENGVALISDWNRVAPLTYASDKWTLGEPLSKVGSLMGYLHYPYGSFEPVERDETKNQIETTDDTLRIRKEPSLDSEIIGHVQIGYYDVLDTKENDGYTWYKIGDGWCANITTNYLPCDDEDFIKEFEKYINNLKTTIKNIKDENTDLKADMTKIREVTLKWKT